MVECLTTNLSHLLLFRGSLDGTVQPKSYLWGTQYLFPFLETTLDIFLMFSRGSPLPFPPGNPRMTLELSAKIMALPSSQSQAWPSRSRFGVRSCSTLLGADGETQTTNLTAVEGLSPCLQPPLAANPSFPQLRCQGFAGALHLGHSLPHFHPSGLTLDMTS